MVAVEVLIEFVVHQAAFAAHRGGAIFKVWHRILHAVYGYQPCAFTAPIRISRSS